MKKNVLPKLSPYRIWWVIVTPYEGCVRKCDIKRLGGITHSGYPYRQHSSCFCFPSKEKALAFVTANHNLSKPYQARILTDKQYGNIRITFLPNGDTVWDIPYTSRQAAEVFEMQ